MDHAFIDRYAVADRYVKRTLPADERAAFEAHLVDCAECADRVLLAAMLRNGTGKPIRVETPPRPAEPLPVKGSNVSSAWLWKVALLFAAAAAALLAVPTAVFLWQLHRLR
jgi:anti-sigma factor RsiW